MSIVANDSVQCFLFHNNGNGTFTEVGLLAGVGFNEDGKTFAGMGVDFADYDNDGRPDIVVTDLSNERYMLFRQNRRRQLPRRDQFNGRGRRDAAFSGWSTRFFDYDNDGWKDLFVAQGHVMDTIEKTAPNLKYLQPPLLLRNESGHFVRVNAGDVFQQEWAGRGAAFGDLDNDGDIDIVVSNVGQSAVRAAQRRRQSAELAAGSEPSGTRRIATGSAAASRWCPPRADAVLHRHDGGRLSLRQRQAADRGSRATIRPPHWSRSDGLPESSRNSRT